MCKAVKMSNLDHSLYSMSIYTQWIYSWSTVSKAVLKSGIHAQWRISGRDESHWIVPSFQNKTMSIYTQCIYSWSTVSKALMKSGILHAQLTYSGWEPLDHALLSKQKIYVGHREIYIGKHVLGPFVEAIAAVPCPLYEILNISPIYARPGSIL